MVGYRVSFTPLDIKLIAIDIDGTLFTKDRTAHPFSVEMIHKAIEAGVTIVLASGRPKHSIEAIGRSLDIAGPIIASNGGQTFDSAGIEISFNPVSHKIVRTVAEYVEAHNLHMNAYSRKELLYLARTRWADVYESRLKTAVGRVAPLSELLSEPMVKVLIISEPDEIERVRVDIAPQIGDAAHMVISEPEYLEFLSPNADKGSGLQTLAKHMGLDRSNIAAIGDYWNDAGMLKFAGFSGAVRNALPEVQALCDIIVKSNEEGGVGEFIRKCVFEREFA